MFRSLICLLGVFTLSMPGRAADIAITFENAPNPATPLLGAERAKKLIAGMKDAGVEQTIFFAVGKYLDRDGLKRLKLYADAGHMIGSGGYSQRTVDELGSTEFVRDIKQNDLLVKDLPGFKMWLRFPGLNQGGSVAARDNVREWIYHMLYGRSQVTIDTPDEQLDRMIQAGVAHGRQVDVTRLGQMYVSAILSCVEHYDALARAVLGTSPKHTLRLHENDLAALFVGDLARALRAAGHNIIPANEALNEQLNRYEANIIPLNGSHVLAIAKERGNEAATPAPIEDPETLQVAVEMARVWQ